MYCDLELQSVAMSHKRRRGQHAASHVKSEREARGSIDLPTLVYGNQYSGDTVALNNR